MQHVARGMASREVNLFLGVPPGSITGISRSVQIGAAILATDQQH